MRECERCRGSGQVPDIQDVRNLRPPGITQRDFARVFGFDPSYIAQLEAGWKSMSWDRYEQMTSVLKELEENG